ncbi:RimK family alpha-L-glutamate ligase [Kitasatospora sp. NBC_01300]|uniref:ATP-grasp domain-containing protein n=1 Tax=Kitasatospora sp. NBC_01300 TaxID=2903574 RepID=UPI00352D6864|nr:ATP-grasp domain-containing protein [Kitasatospora sp. NBC_01300]
MRLCFLVEEHYRHDGMPLDVARRLTAWGHRVDVLRPGDSLMAVSEAIRAGSHDAWVLKTVSGGPGLTLLDAAAAVGLTTVNDVRSIRGVRDKALASVIASTRGLPVPVTYATARWERLAEIPAAEYPLVVKPADGSSGRAVRLVPSPDHLLDLGAELADEGLLIAQPYVPNSGTDLKVYCVDGELFATERSSPLHPGQDVRERQVPLSGEVARIAAQVGEVFGLDLYGVDVLLGPDGPVVVDINDFPSFRQVPDAVARVARAVLRLARSGTAVSAPAPALVPAGGGAGYGQLGFGRGEFGGSGFDGGGFDGGGLGGAGLGGAI